MVPPRVHTNTDAPIVERPGCSNTISGSRPTSSRIRLPSRRHSAGSWVCSSVQNSKPSALRSITCSTPSACSSSARSGLDTTRDRRAAAVEHVLARVRADAAARAPDQDGLALRHLRAVRAHEHPVARGVGERVDRRLLPGEVRGLRHQLVGLHHGELAEAAVVGLVAPDALVGGEHRVVVRARVLVVDVVAVHGDRVAGLPDPHRRADPQHDAGGVAADDVERLVVPGAPDALRPSRCRKPKVGSGSKIDVQTVLKLIDDAITATSASSGASSGNGTSSRWSDFRGSFSVRRHAREHLLLVGPHDRTPVRERAAGSAAELARPWRPATIASIRSWRRSPSWRADGTIAGRLPSRSFVGGLAMPGSVIVSSARTPIGKLSGALGLVRGHRPRWTRDRGRARAGRDQPATRSTT